MPRRIAPRLVAYARIVRTASTPFEDQLRQRFRGAWLEGLKFSRQIVLRGFICDFVCRNLRLVIEMDGDTHDRARDADRDHALGRMGYRVLRFTYAKVGSNIEGALALIAAAGRPSTAELSGGVIHRHPPSPGRKG